VSRSGKSWTKVSFETTRDIIRNELNDAVVADPSISRCDHAMRAFARSQDDLSAQGMMRTFILIMICLSEHRLQSRLTDREVKQFTELAHNILRLNKIRPVASQISFLYGDLHATLSQIMRREGRQSESAWEQLMSNYLGAGDSSRGIYFFHSAQGFRALRLGYGHVAINKFRLVMNSTEADSALRVRAALGLMICARLNLDDELASNANTALLSLRLSEEESQEVAWEKLSFQAARNCNLDEMVTHVVRSKSTLPIVYQVEAKLWTLTTRDRKWIDRLPKVSSMLARPEVGVSARDAFYGWAKTFEQLLDSDIPFMERLRIAGDLWSDSDRIISLDKQILALACLGRWLARNRSYDFAALVLGKLRLLSVGISSGKNDDSSGLVSDLLAEPWCLGFDSKTDESVA